MKKKFLFAALLICGTLPSVAEEKQRYQDASLPVEERVEDLLRRMTLHEKVLQLQNNSNSDINAVESHYKESTGTMHEMSKTAKEAAELFKKLQHHLRTRTPWGIPALITVEGINGVLQDGCTIFPQAIAQGSTFNPDLVEDMAEAIGQEAHVIGIRQLQCPVLDIARELRWGRVEETFGEDPFLIGEMGTSFVRGSQTEGVGAMPKHFVAHVHLPARRRLERLQKQLRDLQRRAQRQRPELGDYHRRDQQQPLLAAQPRTPRRRTQPLRIRRIDQIPDHRRTFAHGPHALRARRRTLRTQPLRVVLRQ